MASFRLFGRKKIGLALSGGMARCWAHIGVLKILKKEKIPIDYIAGTSAGAIVGALYAFGLDPLYIEEVMSRKDLNILKVSLDQMNPFSDHLVERLLEKEIKKVLFKDARIPLAVVATDFKTGAIEIIRSGKVAPAVAASCTFPGVFKPKRINNHLLIDGGVSDNLPVDVLVKMGAELKIAVDAVSVKPLKRDNYSPIEALSRAVDLILHNLTEESRRRADVLIEPDIPADIWQTDFNRMEEIIQAGQDAAEKKISLIKRWL